MPGNILNRNFSSDVPMKKLVTDITYLPTKEGWCYLNAILDLFNREIISYRISKSMTLGFVLETVKDISNESFCDGTLLHSDQGFSYTNPAFRKLLYNLNLIQSISRKGNCWDNACMENFFGILKSELNIPKRSPKNLKSFQDMRASIDQYIFWYNNERIQKKLGYTSPIQYRINIA